MFDSLALVLTLHYWLSELLSHIDDMKGIMLFNHVVLSVCMCMYMFMYMCKYVWKWMLTCMWRRPEVNLGCLPLWLSTSRLFCDGLPLSVGHTYSSRLVDQQAPGTLLALSFPCLHYRCILQHLALKLGAEEQSSSPYAFTASISPAVPSLLPSSDILTLVFVF